MGLIPPPAPNLPTAVIDQAGRIFGEECQPGQLTRENTFAISVHSSAPQVKIHYNMTRRDQFLRSNLDGQGPRLYFLSGGASPGSWVLGQYEEVDQSYSHSFVLAGNVIYWLRFLVEDPDGPVLYAADLDLFTPTR
jgi:hypothetical protein